MYHIVEKLDELTEEVTVCFEYEDAEPEVNAPQVLNLQAVFLKDVDILEVLNKETIAEIEQKILSYKE